MRYEVYFTDNGKRKKYTVSANSPMEAEKIVKTMFPNAENLSASLVG